jgi:hypothetical protein
MELELTRQTFGLLLIATSALAGVRSNQAQAQSSQHYICSAGNTRAIYSSSSGRSCAPLSVEADFVDLISTPHFLVTYHPGSIVKEGDTVKVWVATYLASPVPDDNGRFRYDSVKASYKFFCKGRQQLLVQGTYSLGHSRVYERLSNESVMEEIEPNTLASTMLGDFCDPSSRTLAPRAAAPAGSSTDFVCPESLPSDAARQAQLQVLRHAGTERTRDMTKAEGKRRLLRELILPSQ